MVATSTPDFLFPSTASLVQAELGCLNAGAFDLNAACSGFLYGMALADSSIESGASRRILLCGADTLTAVTDYSDAHSCVLFGDGAGAVVFEAAVDDSGLGPFILRSDGSDPSLLYVDADEGLIKMQGREVYRRAVDGMTKAVTEVLARSGIGIADVGLVIAHQANARIIEAVASRLDIDPQKLPVSIEMIGNTASASIPIAICQAADEGLLSAGDVVVITAFGAGFTWGAGLIRWDPVRSPNQATGERLLVDVALTGTP
jgi:3-oxoacyl-[acyl-carrier-protein] synthase-3